MRLKTINLILQQVPGRLMEAGYESPEIYLMVEDAELRAERLPEGSPRRGEELCVIYFDQRLLRRDMSTLELWFDPQGKYLRTVCL